ncbi:putative porin [Prosthecochloris sp.]|uniref:putative porin n=1 Tax=Prosthecochloris sp. TaxID=290513 RepID=UPI00257C5A2E|nr:putative porin [Prosthecochloris sp.]
MKNFFMLLVFFSVAGSVSDALAVDWNWKGDVMYRYQIDNPETKDNNRDSHRLRVRIGGFPAISDVLSAGIELSTGGSNPVSRMQVLGEGFTAKSFKLNQAYIDFHPMAYGLDGHVDIIFGKRAVNESIIRVNDLLWDADLTMEGISLHYGKDGRKHPAGLSAVLGYYLIDESGDIENDPAFWVSQLAWNGKVDNNNFMIGAGFYNYLNIAGANVSGWAYKDKLFNNSGTGSGTPAATLKYDYDVLEIFMHFDAGLTGKVPLKVYGQCAINVAEDVDEENKAYLFGAKLGKATKPGRWEIDANYCYIEKDALLGAFTDGTRFGGGTDGKGFELGGKYLLVKNLMVSLKYYNHDQGVGSEEAGEGLDIWQADLVVKF